MTSCEGSGRDLDLLFVYGIDVQRQGRASVPFANARPDALALPTVQLTIPCVRD
jgi:hypothetical protein